MSESTAPVAPFSLRTVWDLRHTTPLRRFVRTEAGSAAVLLAATVAALVWANTEPASYAATWHTVLEIRSGKAGIADSWQGWVNSGLMAFFFLVAGLEARREFDIGELRERRRLVLPVVVALGGMVVPVAIYLSVTAGRSSAAGWGAVMSTDTAFALGALALAGRDVPDRVRSYLLTFAVADDVAGISVIALVYSGHLNVLALSIGVAILGAVLLVRWRRIRYGPVYLVLGISAWIAFFESGVDPVVVGLAVGLLALAYPASRADLEHATETFRLFREQPTAGLAREAGKRTAGCLAQRPAATAVPPLDELPDRAAVRARQRRYRGERQLPGPRLQLTGHARHPGRLRGRKAGRHGRSGLAADRVHRRPDPAVRWLGIGCRSRLHRRHRLCRVAAHRLARLARHRAGRGQGGHPVRGDIRNRARLGRVPRHRAAAAAAPAAGAARAR
jgi:hypothetical protein